MLIVKAQGWHSCQLQNKVRAGYNYIEIKCFFFMKEKEAEPMEEDDVSSSKQVIETVVGKCLKE